MLPTPAAEGEALPQLLGAVVVGAPADLLLASTSYQFIVIIYIYIYTYIHIYVFHNYVTFVGLLVFVVYMLYHYFGYERPQTWTFIITTSISTITCCVYYCYHDCY